MPAGLLVLQYEQTAARFLPKLYDNNFSDENDDGEIIIASKKKSYKKSIFISESKYGFEEEELMAKNDTVTRLDDEVCVDYLEFTPTSNLTKPPHVANGLFSEVPDFHDVHEWIVSERKRNVRCADYLVDEDIKSDECKTTIRRGFDNLTKKIIEAGDSKNSLLALERMVTFSCFAAFYYLVNVNAV